MKPGTPALQSTRLFDQLRERIRVMHYSRSTEKVYLYWVRFFIRWSGLDGPMQHPGAMGAAEVEQFLSMLATERHVSASTHNQALSALLFLYREVLGIDLPWLNDIKRPSNKRRIPSVLTKDEVAGVLANMDGQTALLARLLYGTGMRLMDAICRRIKDVDVARHVIIVREANGNKDRAVMLPRSLVPALRMQLLSARSMWENDRQSQRGGVETPPVGDTVPGFEVVSWFGILAPGRFPAEAAARIDAEIQKALADPAFRQKVQSDGTEIVGLGHNEFPAYLRQDLQKWKRAVELSSAKVD